MNINQNSLERIQLSALNFSSEEKKEPTNAAIKSKDIEKSSKRRILASTIATTAASFLIIRKYQGRSLKMADLKGLGAWEKTKKIAKSFNIKTELKEMILMGFGSVSGGLAGGLLFDKTGKKKNKIKESVFQFMNILVPTSLVAGMISLIEKNKNPKMIWLKIPATIGGIAVGMPAAAVVSNKINNNFVDKNAEHERKLKLKDCFVHVDDFISALVLSKIPFIDKIQADKILPAIYSVCGYEAGAKQ